MIISSSKLSDWKAETKQRLDSWNSFQTLVFVAYSGVRDNVIRFRDSQFCSAVGTKVEVVGENVVAATKGTAFHFRIPEV